MNSQSDTESWQHQAWSGGEVRVGGGDVESSDSTVSQSAMVIILNLMNIKVKSNILLQYLLYEYRNSRVAIALANKIFT